MSVYKIGDKVVYPMHGAGVIEGIEERKILNERMQYYVMRMPIGDMKVLIPIKNTDDIGIRDIIDASEVETVIKKFCEFSEECTSNWNKRYRDNMDRIRNGNIFEVAGVVKTLMMRDKVKRLSTGERKMLSNARQILVSELVLTKWATQEELERRLDEIIEEQWSKSV